MNNFNYVPQKNQFSSYYNPTLSAGASTNNIVWVQGAIDEVAKHPLNPTSETEVLSANGTYTVLKDAWFRLVLDANGGTVAISVNNFYVAYASGSTKYNSMVFVGKGASFGLVLTGSASASITMLE